VGEGGFLGLAGVGLVGQGGTGEGVEVVVPVGEIEWLLGFVS
jgi:hypothetical protein